MRSLEQVLADKREDLAVLRKHGQAGIADALEQFCDEVQDAAEDYLTFLSETDATIFSARSQRWLRARFPEWEHRGHARWRAGARQYRMIVLPKRANPQAAYEAGKAAGRNAA